MKFIATLIISLVAIGAVSFGGYIYIEAYKVSTRSQAVDGCMQASIYRTNFKTEDGSDITTESPIETEVKKCLEQKGVAVK